MNVYILYLNGKNENQWLVGILGAFVTQIGTIREKSKIEELRLLKP